MWPWIKRWRDWAMTELLPQRPSAPPQAIHFGYEKAGLTVHGQPVPWNAEAVVVEALVRLPPTARRKTDFVLEVPGRDPVPAESLRRDEADGRYRLFFRFPPPPRTAAVRVVYRSSHLLGQVTLPALSCDEFLASLRAETPTVFVRIGEQSVACQTFVASQCRGLVASAVLASDAGLAPLADLGLHVEFRDERSGTTREVPVRLCSTQLAGRRALVTAVPGKVPRRAGAWSVSWRAGNRTLATQRVRGITSREFARSLRVCDTRFVAVSESAGAHLRRQPPPLSEVRRLGPCFLVASREPGMAGYCSLQVHAQSAGTEGVALLEERVLVTDGPTLFAPGTLEVAELGKLAGFELRHGGVALGTLSLCPVPTAVFTSEGGFKPPSDFAWSGAAEEELTDRLNRLLGG
jgi:hypothetical protein